MKLERFNTLNEATNPSLMDDGRTIIKWVWKNSRDTVGVVAVELANSKEWTAYLGVGKGHKEREDVQFIADYGYRLSAQEAEGFFPGLDEELKELTYKQ